MNARDASGSTSPDTAASDSPVTPTPNQHAAYRRGKNAHQTNSPSNSCGLNQSSPATSPAANGWRVSSSRYTPANTARLRNVFCPKLMVAKTG